MTDVLRPTHTARINAATLAASYDAHGAAVYGLAHSITRDDAVAAELTADVFATLRFIGDGGVDGLRSCVLTDVHRRAVAWVRAQPRPSGGSVGPLAGFGALPPDEQAVVAEAYFGGKTYDEVAAVLGLPRNQVAQLMHDALRRLGDGVATTP